MRYKIFDGETQINTIVADEAFVKRYCASNGYTYELDELPIQAPTPEPEADLTDAEMAAAILEGVNAV